MTQSGLWPVARIRQLRWPFRHPKIPLDWWMAAKGQGARSQRWLTAGSEPRWQTPRLLPLRNHSLGPQDYWDRPLSMFVPKTVETREGWTDGQTCALQQVRPRRSNAPQQTFKDTPIDCRLFFDNVIPLDQMKESIKSTHQPNDQKFTNLRFVCACVGSRPTR